MIYSRATPTTTDSIMSNRKTQEQEMMVKEIRSTFARNLRTAREVADMSQEQLEERTGFSQQFISGLETKKNSCTLDTAYVLAKGLKVPLCKLVCSGD